MQGSPGDASAQQGAQAGEGPSSTLSSQRREAGRPALRGRTDSGQGSSQAPLKKGASTHSIGSTALTQHSSVSIDGDGGKRVPNYYENAAVRAHVRMASQSQFGVDDLETNFVAHGRTFRFSPRSLFLFTEESPFRQAMVWLVTWRWFENVILCLIVANSILLAQQDYRLQSLDPQTMEPDPSRSLRNQLVEESEVVFTVLFTIEAAMKVVAMGFWMETGAYLRDGWNWLDFIVVLSGLVSAIPGMPKIAVLRTLRVLRPLRSLTVLPGMRVLVSSLLGAIPKLLQVLALLGFAFAIVGILGVQLWAGLLHARCRLTDRPLAVPAWHLAPPPGAPGDVQPLYFEATERFFDAPDVTVDRFREQQIYFWQGLDANASAATAAQRPSPDTAASGELVHSFLATALQSTLGNPQLHPYSVFTDHPSRRVAEAVAGTGSFANTSAADVIHYIETGARAYYVTYPQAVAYVAHLLHNRTAFPACGAGEADGSGGVFSAGGIPLHEAGWTQSSSPWHTPRQCTWPLDESLVLTCDMGNGGKGRCDAADSFVAPFNVSAVAQVQGAEAAQEYVSPYGRPVFGTFEPGDSLADAATAAEMSLTGVAGRVTVHGLRVCGSNYDELGNPRFSDARVMREATFRPEFQFHLTGFDWVGQAFLSILQVITLEGWSQMMYNLQGAYVPIIVATIFTLMVFFGAFFMLNLTLAVLWESFSAKDAAEKEAQAAARRRLAEVQALEEHERKLEQLRRKEARRQRREEKRARRAARKAAKRQREREARHGRRRRRRRRRRPKAAEEEGAVPSPPTGPMVEEADEGGRLAAMQVGGGVDLVDVVSVGEDSGLGPEGADSLESVGIKGGNRKAGGSGGGSSAKAPSLSGGLTPAALAAFNAHGGGGEGGAASLLSRDLLTEVDITQWGAGKADAAAPPSTASGSGASGSGVSGEELDFDKALAQKEGAAFDAAVRHMAAAGSKEGASGAGSGQRSGGSSTASIAHTPSLQSWLEDIDAWDEDSDSDSYMTGDSEFWSDDDSLRSDSLLGDSDSEWTYGTASGSAATRSRAGSHASSARAGSVPRKRGESLLRHSTRGSSMDRFQGGAGIVAVSTDGSTSSEESGDSDADLAVGRRRDQTSQSGTGGRGIVGGVAQSIRSFGSRLLGGGDAPTRSGSRSRSLRRGASKGSFVSNSSDRKGGPVGERQGSAGATPAGAALDGEADVINPFSSADGSAPTRLKPHTSRSAARLVSKSSMRSHTSRLSRKGSKRSQHSSSQRSIDVGGRTSALATSKAPVARTFSSSDVRLGGQGVGRSPPLSGPGAVGRARSSFRVDEAAGAAAGGEGEDTVFALEALPLEAQAKALHRKSSTGRLRRRVSASAAIRGSIGLAAASAVGKPAEEAGAPQPHPPPAKRQPRGSTASNLSRQNSFVANSLRALGLLAPSQAPATSSSSSSDLTSSSDEEEARSKQGGEGRRRRRSRRRRRARGRRSPSRATSTRSASSFGSAGASAPGEASGPDSVAGSASHVPTPPGSRPGDGAQRVDSGEESPAAPPPGLASAERALAARAESARRGMFTGRRGSVSAVPMAGRGLSPTSASAATPQRRTLWQRFWGTPSAASVAPGVMSPTSTVVAEPVVHSPSHHTTSGPPKRSILKGGSTRLAGGEAASPASLYRPAVPGDPASPTASSTSPQPREGAGAGSTKLARRRGAPPALATVEVDGAEDGAKATAPGSPSDGDGKQGGGLMSWMGWGGKAAPLEGPPSSGVPQAPPTPRGSGALTPSARQRRQSTRTGAAQKALEQQKAALFGQYSTAEQAANAAEGSLYEFVDASGGEAPQAGCLLAARMAVQRVVASGWFNGAIVAFIIANTVVLALDQYPLRPVLATNLEIANFAISMVFVVEMGLKLFALGPRDYVSDAFNIFDAFIVLVSLLELGLSPPSFLVGGGADTDGGGGISALRTFRLFRVFKLARSWTSLRVLLNAMTKTLADVANFSVLLLLFIFIFALIGEQLFANRFRFHPKSRTALVMGEDGYLDADVPRSNFDSLLWASVAIFQVLTGEDWPSLMYSAWRATGVVGVVYMVALVVLGNFVILNLFLAILLGNFEGADVGATSTDEDVDLPTAGLAFKLDAAHLSSTGGAHGQPRLARLVTARNLMVLRMIAMMKVRFAKPVTSLVNRLRDDTAVRSLKATRIALRKRQAEWEARRSELVHRRDKAMVKLATLAAMVSNWKDAGKNAREKKRAVAAATAAAKAAVAAGELPSQLAGYDAKAPGSPILSPDKPMKMTPAGTLRTKSRRATMFARVQTRALVASLGRPKARDGPAAADGGDAAGPGGRTLMSGLQALSRSKSRVGDSPAKTAEVGKSPLQRTLSRGRLVQPRPLSGRSKASIGSRSSRIGSRSLRGLAGANGGSDDDRGTLHGRMRRIGSRSAGRINFGSRSHGHIDLEESGVVLSSTGKGLLSPTSRSQVAGLARTRSSHKRFASTGSIGSRGSRGTHRHASRRDLAASASRSSRRLRGGPPPPPSGDSSDDTARRRRRAGAPPVMAVVAGDDTPSVRSTLSSATRAVREASTAGMSRKQHRSTVQSLTSALSASKGSIRALALLSPSRHRDKISANLAASGVTSSTRKHSTASRVSAGTSGDAASAVPRLLSRGTVGVDSALGPGSATKRSARRGRTASVGAQPAAPHSDSEHDQAATYLTGVDSVADSLSDADHLRAYPHPSMGDVSAASASMSLAGEQHPIAAALARAAGSSSIQGSARPPSPTGSIRSLGKHQVRVRSFRLERPPSGSALSPHSPPGSPAGGRPGQPAPVTMQLISPHPSTRSGAGSEPAFFDFAGLSDDDSSSRRGSFSSGQERGSGSEAAAPGRWAPVSPSAAGSPAASLSSGSSHAAGPSPFAQNPLATDGQGGRRGAWQMDAKHSGSTGWRQAGGDAEVLVVGSDSLSTETSGASSHRRSTQAWGVGKSAQPSPTDAKTASTAQKAASAARAPEPISSGQVLAAEAQFCCCTWFDWCCWGMSGHRGTGSTASMPHTSDTEPTSSSLSPTARTTVLVGGHRAVGGGPTTPLSSDEGGAHAFKVTSMAKAGGPRPAGKSAWATIRSTTVDSSAGGVVAPPSLQHGSVAPKHLQGVDLCCFQCLSACMRVPCCARLLQPTDAATEATDAHVASTDGGNGQSQHMPMMGRSLCLFSAESAVRRAAYSVVTSPIFDNVILVLILISSVMLAVDSPLLDPASQLARALYVMDVVFTAAFVAEALLKILAKGFLLGPGAYLKSGWNILDFGIIALSTVTLSGLTDLRGLRALRSLRALRPLRVISRNPGLRLVVNSLFRAVPAILNVLLVCLLFFLIFGVVGVSYFKGTFYACQGHVWEGMSPEQQAAVVYPVPFSTLNPTQRVLWWGGNAESAFPNASAALAFQQAVQSGSTAPVAAGADPQVQVDPSAIPSYTGTTSRAVCEWMGAEFERTRSQDFDNSLNAMGALFEVSTTEQWVDVMLAGVDARGVDMQPVENNEPAWVAFFIAFQVLGGFFLLNMFVGVVIDSFTRLRAEGSDNFFLTPAQVEWVRTQTLLQQMRPRPRPLRPRSKWPARLYDVVTAPSFDVFIMGAILTNTVVMAMQFFGQPDEYGQLLDAANLMFAVLFSLEAAAKIYALGASFYFRDNWNRFDFAIVVGTNFGLILTATLQVDVGSIATVVRTFRVLRIVRLINTAKALRVLFNTLILTLPSLGNVASLLLLLLFIYAVMGLQLFALVKFGEVHTADANFRTWPDGMLTLISASTGENWNGLMADLAVESDCNPDPRWDDETPTGCGTPAAVPFFYTYELLVSFVALQIFVAVILEGFADVTSDEDARLDKQQLERFSVVWTQLDPHATMFITTERLVLFLRLLPAPLGFGDGHEAKEEEVVGCIREMDIPTYAGNLVHFSDVAIATAKRVLAQSEEDLELMELPPGHSVTQRWETLRGASGVQRTSHGIAHIYAARAIWDTFRTFKFRQQMALDMAEYEKERAMLELLAAKKRRAMEAKWWSTVEGATTLAQGGRGEAWHGGGPDSAAVFAGATASVDGQGPARSVPLEGLGTSGRVSVDQDGEASVEGDLEVFEDENTGELFVLDASGRRLPLLVDDATGELTIDMDAA